MIYIFCLLKSVDKMSKLTDISKVKPIPLNDRDRRITTEIWRAHAVAKEKNLERDFYEWRHLYDEHLVGMYNLMISSTSKEKDNETLSFPDFCRFMFYTADTHINKYGQLKRVQM